MAKLKLIVMKDDEKLVEHDRSSGSGEVRSTLHAHAPGQAHARARARASMMTRDSSASRLRWTDRAPSAVLGLVAGVGAALAVRVIGAIVVWIYVQFAPPAADATGLGHPDGIHDLPLFAATFAGVLGFVRGALSKREAEARRGALCSAVFVLAVLTYSFARVDVPIGYQARLEPTGFPHERSAHAPLPQGTYYRHPLVWKWTVEPAPRPRFFDR